MNVKVIGSARVANNMRAAAAASKNTAGVAYKWGQSVRRKLKGTKYPSRLAHFKHRRTGALANSWRVEKSGRNSVHLVNSANRKGFPYPIVVVGNAKGERKGRATHPSFKRWWIAREVIEEEVPALRNAILDDIIEEGEG